METTKTYNLKATEHILPDANNVCLNFKISQQLPESTTKSSKPQLSNQYILFVLDISGSMAGTALETCKGVLIEIFEYLYNELGNTNFDLITFNIKPYFIELKNKSLKERLDAIRQIEASLGTAFIPVFDNITELLTNNSSIESAKSTSDKKKTSTQIQNMSIMFLSDGQAEPFDSLLTRIEDLSKVFRTYTSNCEFHTLGFTASHDAKLLTELTRTGTAQGTFQFIESSKDIQSAMDALSGLFARKKMHGRLEFPEEKGTLKIEFDEVENGKEGEKLWDALVFLNIGVEEYEKVKSGIKVEIRKEKEVEIWDLVLEKEQNIEDKALEIKLNLLAMHESLNKVTFMLMNNKMSGKQVEEFNGQLNESRKRVEGFVKEIFKLKIASREPLFEMVEDLKKYLATFNDLIKSNFINQLSNEQIAKLNSMAYRNVTRKGLLKKLDKRAQKSVPIINEAFEKVKQISSAVDEDGLAEKYSELIEKVGYCALSTYSFVEALKDEDCLCVTFDIKRPQAAISDATRIQIKKIFPTIISARAFMDSAKYSLSKTPEASGGFEAGEGCIVRGVGAENITAVLPIYICKEHWEIASLLMKPILGWDITLDPVGYSYFQKKVLPFQLLAHTLRMKMQNPESEFNKRIYELLEETCVHIVEDDMSSEFNGTMKEDVMRIHEKYLSEGAVRTSDSVQSSYVHLSHVYVFVKMGLIEKPSKEDLVKMLKYMAEEELRRRQVQWDASMKTKYVTELLRIDVGKWLKKLEEEEAKKEEKKEEEKKGNEEEKEKLEIPVSEFLDGPTFSSLDEKQKQALTEYNNLYKMIYSELFEWISFFFPEEKEVVEEYSSLAKIGIDSSAKFLCLYVQNKLQANNADRKSAFAKGRYLSPWSEETAVDFLQRIYRRVVLAEKHRRDEAKKLKMEVAKKAEEGLTDLQVFARTENMQEARDIIAGGMPKSYFDYFKDVLRSDHEHNKKIKEKIALIQSIGLRTHTGAPIFTKRFLRKLFKTYMFHYNYNEWKELWYK